MSIGQGLSSNYYSLIVFVAGVLTAAIYVTIMKEDDNNNNHLMMDDSDDDPFFSMTVFGACLPLALSYTCFAHAWLSVISRIGIGNGNDNGLQQWRKTPIIVASSDVINPTTTTTTKKLAIITGSNTGIGYETARRLVQEYGWDVILACRSKDKALIAKNKINNYETENDDANNGKAIVLNPVLDLSDFDSIRKFVDAVENEYDNVDVLINNAGRNTSGRSPGNPNLDLMFQSNYLGHFLLTELMLKNKLLLSTTLTTTSSNGGSMITGNKVINLSSVMHHFAKGDSIDRKEGGGQAGSISSPNYWKRRALYHDDNDIRHPNNIYAASKIAAILHTVELNRRYGRSSSSSDQQPHLTAIAVNPGAVNSDIWRDFPNWVREYIFDKIYLSTEEGSEPIVAAAIRNDLDTHHEDSTTSSTTNIGRGTIIYLQPYANPFSIFGGRWFPDSSSTSSSSSSFSMIPFTEIFGPYVGHLPTTPRLPKNLKTTEAAAKVLWDVSEELTNVSTKNE
jgi:NAD(P)-dependent dehydrogenase (short-subunit alcohol dehydrogenase family)